MRLEWEAVSVNVLTLDGLAFCCSAREVSVQLPVSGAKTEQKSWGQRTNRLLQ